MADHPACCRPADGGLLLFVRLTPKSSRDAVEGMVTADDGSAHLKVRVRAVPEGGKANTALEKLLARTFGIPASSVALKSGATARLKTIELHGETAALIARTAELAGRDP